MLIFCFLLLTYPGAGQPRFDNLQGIRAQNYSQQPSSLDLVERVEKENTGLKQFIISQFSAQQRADEVIQQLQSRNANLTQQLQQEKATAEQQRADEEKENFIKQLQLQLHIANIKQQLQRKEDFIANMKEQSHRRNFYIHHLQKEWIQIAELQNSNQTLARKSAQDTQTLEEWREIDRRKDEAHSRKVQVLEAEHMQELQNLKNKHNHLNVLCGFLIADPAIRETSCWRPVLVSYLSLNG